ncbi:MAG: hypothetical protein R3F30_09235 [Planctomycetota bacterium]
MIDRLLPQLVAGRDPVSEVLRDQLRNATIGGIELSGAGFFVDIDVPPDLPTVAPRNITGGSADIELAGVPHGAGCLLFVREGRLSMLECYTYVGEWTEDTEVLSVKDIVPIRPTASEST